MHATTLAALAATCSVALAGPLTPPAGAPAPTSKTLAEVEPRIALNADNTPGDADSVFKITEIGSYYLTDNLRVPEGFTGIEITQDCTVDLNGFNIQRDASITAGTAISINTNDNAAVRIVNGSVRLLPSGIIDAGTSDRVSVQHVSFVNIDGDAIDLDGLASIAHCTFDNVDGAAISAGANAAVHHVRATDCGLTITGAAIDLSRNAQVSDVTVEDSGATSLLVGSRSSIRDVRIYRAGGVGIDAGRNARIVDATVEDAGSDGMRLRQAPHVQRAIVNQCAGVGAFITTTPPQDDTTFPPFARFIDCTFISNVGGAIDATDTVDAGLSSTFISGCLFHQAGESDIAVRLLRGSRVERCHFIGVGVAVQTELGRNTVIDCSFTNNVVLNSNNNFIARNTFSGIAVLIDNNGGSFAPTPTSTPSSAWDNIDQ